jgi:hypothetical protein
LHEDCSECKHALATTLNKVTCSGIDLGYQKELFIIDSKHQKQLF